MSRIRPYTRATPPNDLESLKRYYDEELKKISESISDIHRGFTANQITYTANTLPAANTSGLGARAFVTDANNNVFNAIVYYGGSNNVPVFSDGTDWRVG